MFNRSFFFLLVGFLPAAQVWAESFQGRLLDSSGIPVAGFHLMLNREGEPALHVETRQDGAFLFANLKPGWYGLRVRELGFNQVLRQVEVPAGQDLFQEIVLPLAVLQETVQVTATRTEAAASLIGPAVTVITGEQIRSQNALNVADVLRAVPGVAIARNGGPGSVTSLFIRGGDSDYAKVLLDGIPLNEPGGAVDLSNLSTTNVDRIEIVRGAQSALYGSEAMSGVVQIFTRRGSSETLRPRVNFSLEGGSFDTFQGGSGISGEAGPLAYSAEFRHLSTRNQEPNDFFHSNSFSSRIDWQAGERSSLTLVGRLERARSGVPGPTAFGRPDLEEFSRKRDLAFGLSWQQSLTDSWAHRISYSQSYTNQFSADPFDSGPYVPSFEGRQAPFASFDFPFSFLNAARRHVVNYQSDFLVARHALSAGVDYEEERGRIDNVNAARTNLGYYFQDQFLLFQRLSLTGGIRLEDNGSFGFFASPRASASFLLRDGGSSSFWGMTRPRFSFGLGIKEPSFIESFSPNFFFQGNPDLEPERSRTFEGGIEQWLFEDRVRLELNLFHNRFKDQIAFQIIDFETFEASFFNLGESRAWGSEQVLEFRPTGTVWLSGGYTWLRTHVIRSLSPFSPVFQEGEPLLRRPAHSGFVKLRWHDGPWKVSSQASFAGQRADSDFAGLDLMRVGGYSLWDLSGAYRIRPELELFAVFHNLLNQEYFEVLGFPALKAHFRAGLRVGW